MIKLYGHPVSTCTRKVLFALHETGTPFELTTLDFAKAEHKGAEHLARQPFGQMPAIDDDGFELYESRAIARYIAQKANSTILPTELQARARMEQWISIETSNFAAHAMKYVYEYTFKRPQADGVIDAAGQALDKVLGVMSKQLEASSFLAGSELTIADMVYAPYIEYSIASPAQALYEKYPPVMAWWLRVSARPAWQKVSGRA